MKKFVPGPGSYRMQSDFGYYNPSDIKGFIQSNVYYTNNNNNTNTAATNN